MDLIPNQHLNAEVVQQADCGPFEFDNCGARVLRRAQHRENLREETALIGRPANSTTNNFAFGPYGFSRALST